MHLLRECCLNSITCPICKKIAYSYHHSLDKLGLGCYYHSYHYYRPVCLSKGVVLYDSMSFVSSR